MKEPGEIDQEARAALGAAGARLLGELDTLRGEGIGGDGALDPEAGLALRKRGDAFLAELAEERRVAILVAQRRKWRRRLGAVAAVLVLAFGLMKLVGRHGGRRNPSS